MRILSCEVDEHHTRPWEARSHMYCNLPAGPGKPDLIRTPQSFCRPHVHTGKQKTSCRRLHVSLPESPHSDHLSKAVERVESLGLLSYCGGYLLHVALNPWEVANSTKDLSVKSNFLFIRLNEL